MSLASQALNNLKKKRSGSTTSTTSSKLTKTLGNYETRLENIGVEADSRNPVEKFLNLPEDQNVLFDVFEIIGRPQQALFTGINNAILGDSFTEGLKEGITGETKTSGGEILRNLGIDNGDGGEASLTDPSTWGIDDVLGTALDIFADPVDLALWGSAIPTGGATVPIAAAKSASKYANTGVKLAKGLDTASDATKVVKGLDTASDAVKTVKGLDTALDSLSPLELLVKDKNNAKTILNSVKGATPETTKVYKSTLEKGAELVGKAGKKTASIADKAITKGLNVADNYRNSKFMKTASELGQELDPRYTSNLTNTYEGIKNFFKTNADYSKALPDNTISKINEGDQAIDAASYYSRSLNDKLMSDTENYVSKKLGRAFDATDDEAVKMFDNISADLQKINEADLDTTTKASDFLRKSVSNNKSVDKSFTGTKQSIDNLTGYLDENYKGLVKYKVTQPKSKINNMFTGGASTVKSIENAVDDLYKGKVSTKIKDLGNGKYQIALTKVDDFEPVNLSKVSLSNEARDFLDNFNKYGNTSELRLTLQNNDNLKAIVNSNEINKFDNITLEKARYTDDAYNADIDRINKLMNSDEDFRNLVNSSKEAYKIANKNYLDATGGKVDFSSISDRPGYVRRPLDEDAIKLERAGRSGTEFNSAGNKQVFSSRKRGLTTDEENVLYKNKKQRLINEKESRISNLEKRTYDSLSKKYSENITNIKKAINIKGEKFNEALAKKTAKLEGLKNTQKEINSSLAYIEKNISDDIIKTASRSVDNEIPKRLQNSIDNLSKYSDEFNELSAKLTKDLPDDEIKSINSQLKKLDKKIANVDKQIRLNVEKAKTTIDNNFVKDINKAANKAQKTMNSTVKKAVSLSEKSTKGNDIIEAYSKHIDDFKNNYVKQTENLNKSLKKYELLYNSLDPKMDDAILEQIGQLNRSIEVLKNTEADNLFVNDYFSGFEDYINFTNNNAKAAQTLSNTLLNTVLYDDNYIKVIGKDEIVGKLKPGTIRLGAEDANKLVSKLDRFKTILGEEQAVDVFKKAVNNGNGLVLDKNIYELIKTSNTLQEGEKAWGKIFNTFNNGFKKFKTLTPGFHVRNITGNTTNLYLSGVPLVEIPALNVKANKLISDKYINELVDKYVSNTLTKADKEDWDLINGFIKANFMDVGTDVQDLGELVRKSKNSKNIINKVFNLNVTANSYVDRVNRMSAYIYASKNPKYVARLGATDAADAVRKVLFDPNNLSPFEKNVVKKIIPFYTFTKQNLMYQAQNIFNNTSRYNRLFKTINKSYESFDENSYNQYQKENFEIPLPFKDEKGNIATLKTNLPVSDLGEYLSNPLNRLVSSTSPLIKAPFEQVTGVDTFTGLENQRTPLENILYNTGLDTVTTNQYKKLETLLSDDPTTYQKITALLPSVFRYADSEKITTNKQYQDLYEYQEIVSNLKDQGIDVPSIDEINNKNTVDLKILKDLRSKLKRN